MAVPNTGGVLRTKIEDMQVGDYIACKASNGITLNNVAKNAAYSVGDNTVVEMPLNGLNGTGSGENGKYYFIKVDKGLLVADRVILYNVTWDKLNSLELIQGYQTPRDGSAFDLGIPGILRSLGGGNSYASATGTSATADAGLGAWPQDNEWEKYIVGLFGGADDVWHWRNIVTLCQDTVTTGIGAATVRFNRGYNTVKDTHVNLSSFSSPSHGFRPVFEFTE